MTYLSAHTVDGVQQCESLCDRTANCKTWTFVHEGYDNGPRCALKDMSYCVDPSDVCNGCQDSNGKCYCDSGRKTGAAPSQSCSSPSPQPPSPSETTSFIVPFAANETFDGHFNFRILVDTSVVEIYAYEGRAVGSFMYLPMDPKADGISLVVPPGSSTVFASLEVYSMGSAYTHSD
jgi:hypothetical protein